MRTSSPFSSARSRSPDHGLPDIVANLSSVATMHHVALVHDTDGCCKASPMSRWFETEAPLIR